MNIQNINIKDLKPYPANTKKHSRKQINNVAESIDQFGFKQPIVIDKGGVIVVGHCRYLAAKKLGLKEVPTLVADDLTDEQIKKFRIIDNKVNESEWDMGFLQEELFDLDISDFDLDFNLPGIIESDDEEADKANERIRTNNAYNLSEFDPERAVGRYQMPVIESCSYIPGDLQGFNYVLSNPDPNKGVHFFIDDYQFERVWNRPDFYIEKLMNFPCVLTPDFSLYMDMPIAMKIWNVYRSRMFGQMCQNYGINVIPTLSWAEEETYEFCFDGIEPGGTVAVSTVGVMKDKQAQQIWRSGMDAAREIIAFKNVVCYGTEIDYDFGDLNVKYIASRKGWI